MKICLIFILLLFLGCNIYPQTSQVNTIELEGRYSISFEDTLVNIYGRKCWGLYNGYGGMHRIRIARDCPSIEKYLFHELLHSQGIHHRTKVESRIFDEKMAGYGF